MRFGFLLFFPYHFDRWIRLWIKRWILPHPLLSLFYSKVHAWIQRHSLHVKSVSTWVSSHQVRGVWVNVSVYLCSLCSLISLFFHADLLLKAYLKCMNGGSVLLVDMTIYLTPCWMENSILLLHIFCLLILTFFCSIKDWMCTQSADTVTVETIRIPCKCQNISLSHFFSHSRGFVLKRVNSHKELFLHHVRKIKILYSV